MALGINRQNAVSGVRVNRTTRGDVIVPRRSGGGGGGISKLKRYRLKSVQGDYLTCRTWDGTTEGSTEVLIAKEYKHRNSLTAENIGGSAVTYTYAADPSDTTGMNVIRTTHLGFTTERAHIIPFWVLNEELNAIPADTGVLDADSNLITLRIDGRSCQWAAF